MNTAAVLAGLVVGGVLLLAGVSKLRSRRWPVLALEMGTPKAVVISLPAVESLLGLALILQVGRPATAWLAAAMFLVFTGVVVSQVLSGSEAPCNCFGGKEERAVGPLTIVRNLALVGLAIVAAF